MKNSMLIILFLIIEITFSCKKEVYQTNYNPKIIKSNSNNSISLNSTEEIQLITNQKLQELYDLGLLYVYNNKDAELDSIISNQIDSYFIIKDPSINNLFNEIKNSKSHFIKIIQNKNNLLNSKINDSIFYSKFLIKFYNKKKEYTYSKNKYVKYLIKRKPNKFKKEFKFYFIKFFENDSLN